MVAGMTVDNQKHRLRVQPTRISIRGWSRVLLRSAARVFPDQIGLIAAGVAFYALLAAFPAIAALTALAGLFIEPADVVTQLEEFAGFLPDDAALILISEVNKVAASSNQGLSLALILGVGFAIYLSTRATTSLIHGLNIAFQVSERRGFFPYWGAVICLTMSLLFGVASLLVLLVGLPATLAFVPVDAWTEQILAVSRWVLVACVVLLGLSVLFRWGPSVNTARWRWLTPGSLLSTVLWFFGTVGFSVYVANFGNYNQTFGSLGGVIVLLTWLWLSAFIVLLGAVLDAEVGKQYRRERSTGTDGREEGSSQEADELTPL